MKLFTIVPIAVLALGFAVGAAALVSESRSWVTRGQAEADPPTGMDILNAYACHRGETKKILVRGVEDGFSPAGDEPGFLREGGGGAISSPRQGAGQYDQVNMDRRLLDSFPISGPYSRGLIVVRARALGNNDNDAIGLGDLSIDETTERFGARGGVVLADVPSDPVWVKTGDLFHAAIEGIFVNRNYPDLPSTRAGSSQPFYSVLTYLNDPRGPGWLDVVVQDDTAVDFMGLALCSPPAVKRGVTLMPHRVGALQLEGIVTLSCHPSRNEEQSCDPYVGDTLCSVELPVACLRPGDAPTPTDSEGRMLFSNWSGGTIAVTEPIAGTRFRSVRDVESFCSERFGAGWRVAAIHDGVRYQSVSGKGDPRTITGPVWVDIADQPHATCWARE